MAKKFIEAYGGTIAVWSCPGQETTFHVTFPVHMEI
jgi:signal transduction histidine kinase